MKPKKDKEWREARKDEEMTANKRNDLMYEVLQAMWVQEDKDKRYTLMEIGQSLIAEYRDISEVPLRRKIDGLRFERKQVEESKV